jgi:Uma2 family endonuclease
VRECWIVDPVARTIEVLELTSATPRSRLFEGQRLVASLVLPRLRMSADSAFTD